MRLLFLGFGLPPYFRSFLNRLNESEQLEVYHVCPQGKNRHLGAGVVEVDDEIHFQSSSLPERFVPAKRFLGLSDFEGTPSYWTFDQLVEFLEEERIDLVVVQAVYHSAFVHQKSLRKAVNRLGTRIVFHNIPFEMATLSEALSAVTVPEGLDLKTMGRWAAPIKVIGLDRLYASWIRQRALRKPVTHLRLTLNAPDAHVIYHERGAEIYQSYGVNPRKIHVVRNSPDTNSLTRACFDAQSGSLLLSPNPTRILHVGRLVKWKRVDLLLTAVAFLKLEFPGIDLTVVGDGPELPELERQAQDLGISDRVSFVGPEHESHRLANYLVESTLYVLAGMGGLSINDAMVAGLPVICSHCDGTEKFLVREGKNGFYFKEGDSDDLSEKIARLLRDPSLCHRMGKESRRIIEEELNLDTLVSNYRKVFDLLA